MDHVKLRFQVKADSAALNDQMASELASLLRAKGDCLSVSREREDSQTQDAGAIVVAVLAAPAVVKLATDVLPVLAQGIADWMRKRRCDIAIDGTKVTATNVRPEDVARLLRIAGETQEKT